MQCSKCNTNIIDGANFCESCGTKVEKVSTFKICPQCEAKNESDANVCNKCENSFEAGFDIKKEMFHSIFTCIKKSFEFNGRATKTEYWWFILSVMFIGYLPLFWVKSDSIIVITWGLITCIPVMSVTARRLHDVNFSGWWQFPYYIGYLLALLITIAGKTEIVEKFFELLSSELIKIIFTITPIYSLALLLFLLKKSNPHKNKYG